jgi:type I restriction enzyme M protein
MLDQQQQEAINYAVWQACEVFRGVGDAIDSRDFVLAMLLLKYLSDLEQGVPKDSDFFALQTARHESGNGLRIDGALHAIELGNKSLRGAFQGISFDSTALGSAEQKERVLVRLLDSFKAEALDFRVKGEHAAASVAFACDSIIRQVAAASGKHGGEFFTPPEISQLITRLVQPESGESVCDPCCGSGTLLITCSQFARQKAGHQGCTLYGQEKNGSNWALAKLNMALHGEVETNLEWGDTLRDPKLLASDGSLMKFDVVVSSPPFTLRDWGHEYATQDVHHRYTRGVPPRNAGDYAFISHMVATLKPGTGRMAVVVSLGVLFRGGAEQQIREQLLLENLIDAVIALPAKMFPHTAIPVALLVLRMSKADTNVLFIDASQSYRHGKTQNTLPEDALTRIERSYQARLNVKQYIRLVTQDEIVANGGNLSVARYVDAPKDERTVDHDALRSERAQIRAELESLEATLAALLKEDEE